MITVQSGTVKIKHDKCFNEEMDDVGIGYRCKVCCVFIHKKSNQLKKGKEKCNA